MPTIETYLKETPQYMIQMLEENGVEFNEVVKNDIRAIIITGSGTSYHSGLQMAPMMQELLQMDVRACYPFMLNENTVVPDPTHTLAIGISQSGTSYSAYNALKAAKAKGCITATMCGVDHAFLDEEADYVLPVRCGEELVGAKTKGYYCAKLLLLLLAVYLGKEQGKVSDAKANEIISSVKEAVSKLEETYTVADAWIETNHEKLAQIKEIKLIAPGSLYGDAFEGALKMLETIRIPVTGYNFEEFIHGICNAVNTNTTIFLLDDGTESRMNAMVQMLSKWTDHVYVISNTGNSIADIAVPQISNIKMTTFDILMPIQLMCAKVPFLLSVDPYQPKDPHIHDVLGTKKIAK